MLWAEDGHARPDSPPKFLKGSGKDGVDRVWFHAGRYLYTINADSQTVLAEDARDAAAKYYNLKAEILGATWFQGTPDTTPFLYLAMGETVDVQKYNADLTGTPAWTAVTGIKAAFLCVHDQYLVRITNRNELTVSTDGATFGAPSPALGLGDKTNPVRNIISWNGDVYAGTDDALYKVEIAAARERGHRDEGRRLRHPGRQDELYRHDRAPGRPDFLPRPRA